MDHSVFDILAAIKQEPADSAPGDGQPQGGLVAALQQGEHTQQYGAAHQFQLMSPMPMLQPSQQSDFVARTPSRELDVGSCHCTPLPVMPHYEPVALASPLAAPEPMDHAPATPPPSTSQRQETAMEASIRRMWRARTDLAYDRDVLLDAIMDIPCMTGRSRPASLDLAMGALWKARNGSSPFPYDTVVADFVASVGPSEATSAVADEMARPSASVTTPDRQAPPARPASGQADDARPATVLAHGRAPSPRSWATEYDSVRQRCRERQDAVGRASAKRLAVKWAAEDKQAARRATAHKARNQMRLQKRNAK